MAMYSLNMIQWNNVVAASLIFLIIVLVLVIVLLVAKRWLVNSGEVAISINEGKKMIHAEGGKKPSCHTWRKRCASLVGMRRKRKLRSVQAAGDIRRRRHAAY